MGNVEWQEFDGLPAKVVRSDGIIDVYYGGAFTPDGDGHGHLKKGEHFGDDILYWRLPACEGGRVVVDREKFRGINRP